MEPKSIRVYFIELVGTFGLVLFSAGLVCINETTQPAGQSATAALTGHQPGVVGVALGQGLILAVLLALTVPVSGGYLNPAVSLMLWVFNRLETPHAAKLIGVQLLGSILAALSLRYTFEPVLLQAAQFGAPHLSSQAFHDIGRSTYIAGVMVELLLTFFLVFAIFGMAGTDALRLGLFSGMTMTVAALYAGPLTGAALNPARWLGPTLFESLGREALGRSPWADTLVYLAGPIVGALLGGLFVFYVYQTPGEPGASATGAAGKPKK
jgi:glycerol uptake facilitator-like aquaporin